MQYILRQTASSHARHWSRQRGVSLIESLVALLVLALGIMGLAGVQARMLAENRATNSRAVAVGLIDDLANRMLSNRNEVALGSYTFNFGTAIPAAVDCITSVCNTAERAQSDVNLWRTAVSNMLPLGRSATFASSTDAGQIGILVAWAANEGRSHADTGVDPIDAAYASVFSTPTGEATQCPLGFRCHFVYIVP